MSAETQLDATIASAEARLRALETEREAAAHELAQLRAQRDQARQRVGWWPTLHRPSC